MIAPGSVPGSVPRIVVAGIGLRPGAGAEEIVGLVERAVRASGCGPSVLAVPWFRADEAGPEAAARLLSVALRVVPPDALDAAQPRCRTRSARAQAHVGVASVAEGCALATAGPEARLLLPRIASAAVTCALAGGPGIP